MEVSRASLKERYSLADTEELLGLHSAGTLTNDAYEALEEVLEERGVEIPKRPEQGTIESRKPGVKMKLRWKIYFAVILFQTTGFPLSIFYFGSPFEISEIINWIFIIIGAIGLYCYVFKISVKKTTFWFYFLVAFVLWDLFYLLLWQPIQLGAAYPPAAWFYAIALLLFLIPQYMALYRLSRSSPVTNAKPDSET